MKTQAKRTLALIAFFAMLLSGFVVSPVSAASPATVEGASPASFKVGYVDQIVYPVIEGEEQEVLALIQGEIDIIGEQLNPTYLPVLLADPNINITQTDRQGYGIIHLNTRKAPMNWTAFRRAVAFAVDKETGVQDIWEGYAEPFDSSNPPKLLEWSIESALLETYYNQDQVSIQTILTQAGIN